MVELQKVKVSTVVKKQMAEKSLKTEYYLPARPPQLISVFLLPFQQLFKHYGLKTS